MDLTGRIGAQSRIEGSYTIIYFYMCSLLGYPTEDKRNDLRAKKLGCKRGGANF